VSALVAVAAFALLFALFGALAIARGRAPECSTCPEGSAGCGACPAGKTGRGPEEVEIR
jgi:hypothetical protein